MNKIALLIGINYINTPYELNGCINDIINVQKLLKNNYGYDKFTMISEKHAIKPTKQNIIEQLNKTIDNIIKNNINEFWFSYSGHGTTIRDYNNDEVDNQDEVLVPGDYNNGYIIDDELCEIFKRIPSTCKVFCMFDCCHSGTILDLKYKYINNEKSNLENKERMNHKNIHMISGCMDNQYSMDTWNREKKQYNGALTMAFLDIVKNNNNIKLLDLLSKMRNYLKSRNFTQIPQLTSNTEVDNDIYFCKDKECDNEYCIKIKKKENNNTISLKQRLRNKLIALRKEIYGLLSKIRSFFRLRKNFRDIKKLINKFYSLRNEYRRILNQYKKL